MEDVPPCSPVRGGTYRTGRRFFCILVRMHERMSKERPHRQILRHFLNTFQSISCTVLPSGETKNNNNNQIIIKQTTTNDKMQHRNTDKTCENCPRVL